MGTNPGDIKLNGHWYKIDSKSYQVRDVTDFAPRASVPGGSIVHSELTLYQPIMQTDWKHGFGFNWAEDESGYMQTIGRIDTRHNGIAMLFTDSVASDTDNYAKEGFCTWEGDVYAWGAHGLRKYDGSSWSQAQDTTGTDESSVTLQPASADAFINNDSVNTKYGNQTFIAAGESNDDTQVLRGLIKFDLSDIPSTATITTATLSLYMYSEKSSNARSIYAYRMLKDWQEASVTWNKYDATNSWTAAGGFDSADCEQTDIGSVSLTSTESAGWKTISLTAAKVQEWTNGTLDNFGIMLKTDTETNDQYRFYSSDYGTDSSLRPKLEITYTTPALSDTGTVNFAFPAGDYLYYCPDGARIRKISKEGLDNYTGNDNTAIDYNFMIAHEGYIYVSKDNSTYIHRDSTEDLSDLEGTEDDPDVITVGSPGSYPVIRMDSYAGSLYAAKADGLYVIESSLIARRVLDFTSEASSDNFRSAAISNGYLLFPIRDKIYQWNGTRLSDVTPPRLTDTFPYTTYGRFDNFVAMGRFLYCTARTNESTYNEDLLCFDGVAWSKLANLVSDGTSTVTAMGYDPVNNYLWYHIDATADQTYYIPFQSASEYPYAGFPTTGENSLVFSRWDAGFRWVLKTAPTLSIEARNVTNDRYLTIYYSIDGNSYVEWDKVVNNGITKLDFPGGNRAIEFNYLTIKVQFTTDSSSQSPILESATLRVLMRPETVDGWSFNIPLATGMRMNASVEGRSARQLMQDLRDARDNTGAVEFTDIDGQEYYVHVASLTRKMIEKNLLSGGSSPDLEFLASVNLVESK